MDVMENTSKAYINTTTEGDFGIFGITREFYTLYKLIINLGVTPVVCLFGLCGNSVGIFVLRIDPKSRSLSVYPYMFALMVFDSALLLLGLLIAIGTYIEYFEPRLGMCVLSYFAFAAGYVDFLTYHSSSVILIVMSVERVYALVRPFTVKQFLLAKYQTQIIFVVFVFYALFLLPIPFCFEVLTTKTVVKNETVTSCLLKTKPSLVDFHDRYNTAETIISCVYPFVVLIINIAIPIAYSRALQQRAKAFPNVPVSSQNNQHFKVTMVVLWIAVMYVLLSSPRLIKHTLALINRDYNSQGRYKDTFYTLLFTTDVLKRVNAANDFLIYILVSKRYRKIFLLRFCKWHTFASMSESFSDTPFTTSKKYHN